MATIARRTIMYRSLLAGSAMALMASTAAHAQQPAAPAAAEGASKSEIQEIIVTAQYREQRLQDTPIAITAVSGDMINQRSQTNLTEIANQAPSVTLRPTTAAFGPAISATIRGMGQIDFNPAYEPGL